MVESRNITLRGLQGRIVDETKHTFVVQTDKKNKTVMKKGNVFKIENHTVSGDLINKRPEERLKR